MMVVSFSICSTAAQEQTTGTPAKKTDNSVRTDTATTPATTPATTSTTSDPSSGSRASSSPNSWTSKYTWPPVGASLNIPLIERAPTAQDFKDLVPVTDLPLHMAHIDDFVDRFPTDGARPTQKTEAYLGYDHNNLYVVFACFDTTPNAIRAQIAKRETVFDDDWAEITLDTYKDKRRGFIFASNPVGIQSEGLWDENNGTDWSWDTVWGTNGFRTSNGYMVIMSIPFRSLRFAHTDLQNWGFVLRRVIPRNNETIFWPFVSQKISSRLQQEGEFKDIKDVSPGRNIQIIPYGIWHADRSLNSIDSPPHFEGETLGGRVGVDAKIVLKDSLT